MMMMMMMMMMMAATKKRQHDPDAVADGVIHHRHHGHAICMVSIECNEWDHGIVYVDVCTLGVSCSAPIYAHIIQVSGIMTISRLVLGLDLGLHRSSCDSQRSMVHPLAGQWHHHRHRHYSFSLSFQSFGVMYSVMMSARSAMMGVKSSSCCWISCRCLFCSASNKSNVSFAFA